MLWEPMRAPNCLNGLERSHACCKPAPLAGLRITGFAVWSRRNGASNVTAPTRPCVANGEKKSSALLRAGHR